MPAITLYEYLSRTSARDLTNTVLAKLIKLEALVKLNLFTDAIVLLNRLTKGERLPHFIDDRYINVPGNNNSSVKYTEFGWDSSKPVFDFNNLKVRRLLFNYIELKILLWLFCLNQVLGSRFVTEAFKVFNKTVWPSFGGSLLPGTVKAFRSNCILLAVSP